MLFIIILFILLILTFLAYLKIRHPIFAILVIALIIFLAVESCVYTYFIIQILRGDAMALIGNQVVLDKLYKARLVYALYYLKPRPDYYYVVDDELGYGIGNNKTRYGYGYTSNSFGLRGSKEYSFIPAENKLRIACFGDSFVFCDNVQDAETWESIVERSVGNIEVLNFGVSGYGLGQSYLSYLKRGIRFYPNIIIVDKATAREDRDAINYPGMLNVTMRLPYLYRVKFWIENDTLLYKTTNAFDFFDPEFRERNIYDGLDFYRKNKLLSSKFFSLSNSALLMKVSYIKREAAKLPVYFHSRQVDFKKLSFKILQDFYRQARKNNSTLLFITKICHFETPADKEWKDAFKEDSEHMKFFHDEDFVSKYARMRNLENKDILDGTNHYNALGNQLVAEAVLDILKNNEWDAGDRVFYYDKDTNSFLSREKIANHPSPP